MELQRRYGISTVIFFPMIKRDSLDFAGTADWTPATGDTKITKDEGNVTNTTNNPEAIGGTGSVLWKLALTAAEMQATDIQVQIVDSETKAVEDQSLLISTRFGGQIEANRGIIIGQVTTGTFTPTTTAFEAVRVSPNTTEEATADHYNGRLILFTSGVLLGQQTDITDYVQANSNEKFTVSALTEAPSAADYFVVI